METGLDWLVRGLGVVLIIAGMWSSIMVIVEAWTLYSDPQRIERFAQAIEMGSNLDRSLTSTPSAEADTPSVRLSYFVAWIFALPLLFLMGLLALHAVKVGAGLARPERKPPSPQTRSVAEMDGGDTHPGSAAPSTLRSQR